MTNSRRGRTYKVYPVNGKGCAWLINGKDLFKVGHHEYITGWATDGSGERTVLDAENYSTMSR